MIKKKNVAPDTRNDALSAASNTSTAAVDAASVYSFFSKDFLDAAAKSFRPSEYCPEKELSIEAEAHAMRVVCDALSARENPHAVPMKMAALAVRLVMEFIAVNLGEKNDDGSLKKRAFPVPAGRSEATCARLILAREHIVMVYPDDGSGRPLDAKGEGALVRYVHAGLNAGIHVSVTNGWLHHLADECRFGQSTQRFAAAVAKSVADFVVADESRHVVEDADGNLIVFANGLYDIERGELRPFSPDVVRLHKSPVVWSDTPVDCSFTKVDGTTYDTPVDLIRSWVASDELVHLLLQIVRAAMTSKKIGKMITLYNEEGANGKSTFVRILRGLIGDAAVMSPTIDDLANGRFALADIVGTRLIAIDDSEGGDYVKRAARLKIIITGGRIQIERKNENPFYYAPNVIIIGCVNNFVLSRDKSGGWLRRQLLIPFSAKLLGVEDPRIDDWIQSPEFLTWLAHYALTEVEDFDRLDEPEECKELLHEYERNNDNILEFFEEVIEAIPSQTNPDDKGRYCDFVSMATAWDGYKYWLAKNHPNAHAGKNEFMRGFRAVAAASPNWDATPGADGKLPQRRVTSYANAARQPYCNSNNPTYDDGAALFPVGIEYDPNTRRKYVRYARALTQCGKGGQGRGIVRVCPAASPVRCSHSHFSFVRKESNHGKEDHCRPRVRAR
ncbi:DNA primase family protein [Bifidobacterium dentium]|uniref:DNA primase family protein n=1 Tax=Bifidobacterium dentium TaxID=1689 RepID=UPI0018B0DBAC|nr:phage/plasmid primase, P4 family [Bifidobacterium dentium]MBF9669750.1 hypothetical protein [Bifidobacterium dentium]